MEQSHFHLYTGNKLETLAAEFTRRIYLKTPPDPFRPETVVVQTLGIACWLKLFLAEHAPVAANLDTPFLNNFITRVLIRCTRGAMAEELEKFAPEVLPFRIHRALEGAPERYPELAGYLRGGKPEVRRWQLSERIAELFDQYQVYRPDMLIGWRNGERADPCDWQRRLYLEIFDRANGREQHFEHFFQLRELPPGTVPERVTIFGVGAMPPLFLRFFEKLAAFTEVHFFYLNPCRQYWADQYNRSERRRLLARDGGDESGFEDGNPLLASLGTQGREFFNAILELPGWESQEELFESFAETDPERPFRYSGADRLHTLQQDILDMVRRVPDPAPDSGFGPRLEFPEEDDSVRVHNCHSDRREVEVLHDRLLELLQDPSIQPRDIIVMAPDITRYEPVIDAVFGQGPLAGLYAISDRSLRSSSRIAAAFRELLEMAGGRFESRQVEALLEIPAIRRKFNIAEDDLGKLRSLLDAAAIRWGVDAEDHRARCGIPFPEYAWRQGLDRLLLGVALMPDSDNPAALSPPPLEAAEGNDALLLGHLAAFAGELFRLRELENAEHTPRRWSRLLLDLIDRFFAESREELPELAALRLAVQRPAELAERAGFDLPLPLEVVLELVDKGLELPDRNDRFLRGRITFSSLVPMRSIPMPVVAILGLSDGEFPRRDLKIGFNLISLKIRPCDRSRQLEDRYLFLEALLSARKRLLLFYQGQTAKSDDRFPPAVPLQELIDCLKETAPFEETVHKLQPFDFQYFTPEAGRDFRSYSHENFLAAQSLERALREGTLPEAPPDFSAAAETEPPAEIDLEEFEAFFLNPCQWFLRRRAGLFWPERNAGPDDTEPLKLDPLASYLLRRDLFDWERFDLPEEQEYRQFQERCRLPVGPSGELLFRKLRRQIRRIPERWKRMLAARREVPAEVTIEKLRITGTIPVTGEAETPAVLVDAFSRIKAKYRIRCYLRFLLGSLVLPEAPEGVLLCIDDGGASGCRFAPVGRERATEILEMLTGFFREGWRRPLPLFPCASTAAADAAGDDADRLRKARKAFHDNRETAFDDWADPAIRYCFPEFNDSDPAFGSEFLRLAELLYPPMEPEEPKS